MSHIFYFNSTCELAVSNGSFSYQPPQLLRKMEHDLAILPFLFASERDIVLTDCQPSDHFHKIMEQARFKLPSFYSIKEIENQNNIAIETLQPWGWSPAVHFMFKHIKDRCQEEFKNSPVFDWHPESKKLFERETSLLVLHKILHENHDRWLIDNNLAGQKITSVFEIEQILEKTKALVLKAPVSSSGRGIQFIRRDKLNPANRQWISSVLKQHGYLIAEPYLNKCRDFSFQFKILSETSIDYLGFTVFETNDNGQYQRTLLNPDLSKIFPDETKRNINFTATIVRDALRQSVFTKYYRGFLSVDALLFKKEDRLVIHPCIEINCRMNMGILSKFIEQKIHPGAKGKFELFVGKPTEFKAFENEKMKTNPIVIRDNRLFSGFLPLIDAEETTRFGAYIDLNKPL